MEASCLGCLPCLDLASILEVVVEEAEGRCLVLVQEVVQVEEHRLLAVVEAHQQAIQNLEVEEVESTR